MKYYGKAEETINKILEQFETGNLPKALAQVFVNRSDHVPSSCWSFQNQLIQACYGATDSRGFKQWQGAGRAVKKGERSISILGPCIKKYENDAGEEKKALFGFKSIAVFDVEQTEITDPDKWALADKEDENEKARLEAMPLHEVAIKWGLKVSSYNGQNAGYLGVYRHGQAIGLGVENLSTWTHELVHAADDRNGTIVKSPGQNAGNETVAELGGAILLIMLGHEEAADIGGAWQYVKGYAKEDKKLAIKRATNLIDRTCKAVALILDTCNGSPLPEPDPTRKIETKPTPLPVAQPTPPKPIKSLEAVAAKLSAQAAIKLAKGEEKLNAPRQTNTHRRLRIAQGMEADARRDIEIAITTQNVANEIRENAANDFGIRFCTDVEALRNIAAWSKGKELNYQDYKNTLPKRLKITSNAELKKLMEFYTTCTAKKIEEDPTKKLEREIASLKIPGFFPTPEEIAAKMVTFAEIEPTDLILEPSAGSGNLLKALYNEHPDHPRANVLAIEINNQLANYLEKFGEVSRCDFLETSDSSMAGFNKIIMNPPFDRGADIKHIKRALESLEPGGRLVALCAGGQKQKDTFQPLATHWEELPAGSFKAVGTGVNVSLMVIDKEEEEQESITLAHPVKHQQAGQQALLF